MRFTLHYSGTLPTKASREEIHGIRRELHPQLAELWKQPPLLGYATLRQPRRPGVGMSEIVGGVSVPTGQGEGSFNSVREVGSFVFVPLATEEMKLVATLEVIMMRPEPPGRLINQGGDIDNRLKTLFDAMSMPQLGSLPDGAQLPEENPTFVVLEDDKLITSVNVQTEQLLKPLKPKHVELFIRVHITATALIWGNISLAS